MSTDSALVERFAIGFDIKGFGKLNTRQQGNIQTDLHTLLDRAAENVGIDREPWERQQTGDGEIAVLPPDADMVRIVRRFTFELNEQLLMYNDDRSADTVMRLRVAMHTDAIKRTAHGYAGQALIVLSRLLDSDALHDALESAPRAQLALLVSEPIYQKVGVSGLGGVRPEHFTPIRIHVPGKGFDQMAYLHVPGEVGRDPGSSGAAIPPAPSGPPGSPGAAGRDSYHFDGPGTVYLNQAERDIDIRRQG
jgi:hypothetical protein